MDKPTSPSALVPRAKTYTFQEDLMIGYSSFSDAREGDLQDEMRYMSAATTPDGGRRKCTLAGIAGGFDYRDAEDEERGDQNVVRVVVHEVLSEDFGLFTWPSGIVLAFYIWSRRSEFKGARVVEIGAGTALPGLLAAKLGATVVLTDRDNAPLVLENMRGAVAANGDILSGSCTVAGLTWGDISPTAIKLATEHPRLNVCRQDAYEG